MITISKIILVNSNSIAFFQLFLFSVKKQDLKIRMRMNECGIERKEKVEKN